jgi:methionyl-tRNA formyltransferase
MNLIMMGTGDFAVPTFRRLLDRGYPVRLLVTQPDRPRGRRQELAPAPIKELAIQRGIAVFQPENVNTPEAIERIRSYAPDLLVVAAYGQILSESLVQVERLGGVNLHASLLPKYRGAAPINWAIYHGETVTGVSVIRVIPSLDAGGILFQAETPIQPDETAGELEVRLAELGGPLVCQAVDGLAAGTLKGRKQDRSQATRAPKLKKEDGLIDWTRSARGVCDQIRAMQPWPMPFTYWHSQSGGTPERLIIEKAGSFATAAGRESEAVRAPGTVLSVGKSSLFVKAADITSVSIDRLRPAGKRSMAVAEFLRGNRVQPGDRFGLEQ